MYYGELLKPPTSRGSQGAGGVGGLLKVTDKTSTEENWRGSVYYPTYDGNGNVSEYVDADGTVSAHYEYDAFGNVINSKTTGERAGDFKYKFSTKPRDAETGFYYYGYRYYDPVDGRWLNRDPIEEEGGDNLYGLVRNSAVNFIDSFGLTRCLDCDASFNAKVDCDWTIPLSGDRVTGANIWDLGLHNFSKPNFIPNYDTHAEVHWDNVCSDGRTIGDRILLYNPSGNTRLDISDNGNGAIASLESSYFINNFFIGWGLLGPLGANEALQARGEQGKHEMSAAFCCCKPI